jgi:hypothetical protein
VIVDERALRAVSDPLFIERSSRRLGTSAESDRGKPRRAAGSEDELEDMEKGRGEKRWRIEN